MEGDKGGMSRPIVNKFLIRQSIKELQSRRVFDTLDALTEAVVEDLFDEGFSLGPEERAKIARIVEEEGYTGRFAIDDVLRRKLKNKRWVPLASLVLAVAAFVVSATAAAVIEHYVQKPLDSDRPSAPFTAIFQVPDKAGDLLAFRVKVTNVSGEPLSQIVLFASAGSVAQQYKVDRLDKGQSQTVTGVLDLANQPEAELDFVAYLISGDFSLCSEPTKVARQPNYVAMATSPAAQTGPAHPHVEGSGLGKSRSSGRADSSNESTARQAMAAKKSSQLEHSVAAPSAASALPSAGRVKASQSLRVVSNQQLNSKSEVLRLAGKTDPVSRELLRAYAEAGDREAIRLLNEARP